MRKGDELYSYSKLIIVSVFLGAFFILPQIILADGKHYPERAYKIPPKIPMQRAILVYKDDVEKLIIESALEGQGKEFGWIIPLPSKPIEFEKASPGLIKTISLAVQPEITHDLSQALYLWFSIAIIFTFWLLLHLVFRFRSMVKSFSILCFLLILWGILMPALSKAGKTSGGGGAFKNVEGILIKNIQQIGSYQLAVLEANNADSLDNWLKDNGFYGLSKDDGLIVSDYIKENWCFVAAKLKRESDGGYSQPHPLSMAFKTEKPVYPMRLTSTVGNNVYLEIFVISNQQATCGQLSLEFSDEFDFKKKAYKIFGENKYLPGFVASTYYTFGNEGIGHPDASEIMWDGCVLSKLSGILKPYQMKKDIYLTLKESKPYRKHYWSQQGARQTSLIMFLILWSIICIFVLIIFFFEDIKSIGRKLVFTRILLPSMTISISLSLAVYLLLPKIETVEGKSAFSMLIHEERNLHIISESLPIIKSRNDDFKNMKIEEIRKIIMDYFFGRIEGLRVPFNNLLKNQREVYEDSPGNYIIFEREDEIVLRNFLIPGGFPFDFVLKTDKQISDSNIP